MSVVRPLAAAVSALAVAGLTLPSALADDPVRWRVANAYPPSLVVLGPAPYRTADHIRAMSGGGIDLEVFDPGALVPVLETFDTVAHGAIEAGYTAGTFWSGKDVTFNMFSAVPFGPATEEYLAWMYHGGGQELQDELYGRFNLKSILCGVVTPESAGWFRTEINSVADLEGLRMRFAGLGAQVIEKLGASPQLIAPGDIYTALDRGTIDAAEFSTPAADLSLGLHEVADLMYFPGWHQQAAFAQLLINLDSWNEVSEAQQTTIVDACNATITTTLAEGEAVQAKALRELEAAGVDIRMLPDEVMAALEAAWQEVVEELAAENAFFGEVWDSYATFREDYSTWREIGYLR